MNVNSLRRHVDAGGIGLHLVHNGFVLHPALQKLNDIVDAHNVLLLPAALRCARVSSVP
jgi:hypothetical protein